MRVFAWSELWAIAYWHDLRWNSLLASYSAFPACKRHNVIVALVSNASPSICSNQTQAQMRGKIHGEHALSNTTHTSSRPGMSCFLTAQKRSLAACRSVLAFWNPTLLSCTSLTSILAIFSRVRRSAVLTCWACG